MLLTTLATSSAYAAPQADWWNADWQYRQKITVDATGLALSGDVSNFPVLVRFSGLNAAETALETRVDFSSLNDDASDVVFVSDSGQLLDFEVEIFSKSSSYAAFHVELPTISASQTSSFWVYYGNEGATSFANASAVWDGNFEAVWHVGDPDPADPSTNRSHDLRDASGRGRHKSAKGNLITSPYSYGYYATLDGDGDFWGETTSWDINDMLGKATNVTVSYWFKTTMTGHSSHYYQSPGVLGIQANGSYNDVFYGYVRDGNFGFNVPHGSETAIEQSGVNDGNWHHAMFTRYHFSEDTNDDGWYKGNAEIHMWVDGTLVSSTTNTSILDKTTSVWYVGRIPNGSLDYFDGALDEVRVSSTRRNGDWARLEYVAYTDDPYTTGLSILDYCDGVTYYPDADGDGQGSEVGVDCVEEYGALTTGTDCDDGNDQVYLGAEEVCDGIDNDCDDLVDDDDPELQSSYYADNDGDGLGAGSPTSFGGCSDPGSGWSVLDTDCDDSNVNIGGPTSWWPDEDGDGVGVSAGAVSGCTAPADHVAPTGTADCEPSNNSIYPGAQEVCDASDVDEDCDNVADDADPSAIGQTPWYQDADGDTFGAGVATPSCDQPVAGFVENDTDCNDSDIDINPETAWFADTDGDGYGAGSPTISCTAPAASGWSLLDTDCNDGDITINPDTPWYFDNDGDGWGDFDTEQLSCTSPGSDYVRNSQDCNDNVVNIDPDGDPYYQDLDGDGFGNPAVERKACNQPTGYVVDSTDCDDTNEFVYPTQTDANASDSDPLALCDGFDDNCNDSIDDDGPSADLDGDGKTWAEELALGADGCSTDSDGDGVPDVDEYLLTDSDGDGLLDVIDGDDDGDNIPTANEDYDGDNDPTTDDSDNDTLPDYLDSDDDDDGILTRDEDRNRDGDPTNDESEAILGVYPADGIPDYLDTDDEGDGIATVLEYPHGSHYFDDADNDSIPDNAEWSVSGDLTDPARDTDNDGDVDVVDPDDDGDGIPTFVEAPVTECEGGDDGIPGYLDDDSDGDGILDIVEGLDDADGDGRADFLECDGLDGPTADADFDGIQNQYEDPCTLWDGTGTNPCPGYECLNSGALDSDGDGVPDGAEIGADHSAPVDSDNDGLADVCDDDDDNDTALTVDELSYSNTDTTWLGADCATTPEPPDCIPDQDGNSAANHLDPDDDGDGTPTVEEDYDADGNPHNDDIDWDTIPDYLDPDETDGLCGDPDGDGLPTAVEQVLGSDPNLYDSDGDRVPDNVEYGGDIGWIQLTADVPCPDEASEIPAAVDSDGDGTPNFNDEDDDDDGIDTVLEGAFDIDGDGVPNHLDDDADGDGILDEDEPLTDTDGDGLPDFVDPDNDDYIGGVGDSGVDTGQPVDTCGCQGEGSAGLFLLALPLLAMRRRRR